MSQRPPPSDLSDRQRELARLIARGRGNRQIAEALGVPLERAKEEIAAVRGRLDAPTREAVGDWHEQGVRARRRRWLTIGGGVLASAFVVGLIGTRLSGGASPEAPAAAAAGTRLPEGFLYSIRPGDSPANIARRFGIDARALGPWPEAGQDAQDQQTVFVPAGADALAFVRLGGLRWAPGRPPSLQWPAIGTITAMVRTDDLTGIDVGLPAGTPVLAAGTGRVTIAGTEPCCARGRHVVIDHGGGFATLYANLAETRVAAGEFVSQGQAIGTSGRRGDLGAFEIHFALLRLPLP